MRFHLSVFILNTIGFLAYSAGGCVAETRTFGQGQGGGSSASSSGSGLNGSTGTGIISQIPQGECFLASDCMGGDCYELTPGGYRVCSQPTPAGACDDPMSDQCCADADCMAGKCVEAPLGPQCGGPTPLPHNICTTDQCQSDADCEFGVCLKGGILPGRPVNTCLQAFCLSHGDCNEEPDGVCAAFTGSCCSGVTAVACVYPSDGCRSDGDCAPDFHCELQANRARCVAGATACPL